ncbi:hypothetical protein [Desulfosediminicola ganghwensis]|uniref:hypothetical protein n=1 Tax=Desulfosediminicola ganghwensis TaxID=2569540 RepID=UPI0010AB8D78|nr:hypothetical protein [Desulfosediminicola ganghwensis]
MSEQQGNTREVETFLAEWGPADDPMKSCFQELYNFAADLAETSLTFIGRPGVSYSLRPKHARQSERNLFAIIDVIDDDPAERWLSVCFYGDMISDPDQRGEVIPGGLSGDDGYCFDMYSPDREMVDYLKLRLQEAWLKASA